MELYCIKSSTNLSAGTVTILREIVERSLRLIEIALCLVTIWMTVGSVVKCVNKGR